MFTGIICSVDMTCCTVHKTIQQIDTILQRYHGEISIRILAETCHLNVDQLSAHINVLQVLHYIEFTDRIHENIYLTSAGKYTVVPE